MGTIEIETAAKAIITMFDMFEIDSSIESWIAELRASGFGDLADEVDRLVPA